MPKKARFIYLKASSLSPDAKPIWHSSTPCLKTTKPLSRSRRATKRALVRGN
jgi:hypothetical protein